MSYYIFEIESNIFAIIDIVTGSIRFKNSVEELPQRDCNVYDKHKKLIELYVNKLQKNRILDVDFKNITKFSLSNMLKTIRNLLEMYDSPDFFNYLNVYVSCEDEFDCFILMLKSGLFDFNFKERLFFCDLHSLLKNISDIKYLWDKGFKNIICVSSMEQCHRDKSEILKITSCIEKFGDELINISLLFNVTCDDLKFIPLVYSNLFMNSKMRNVIKEILVNCIHEQYVFNSDPKGLFNNLDIECYENALYLFSQKPFLLFMRITGNKYLRRFQNVLDFRASLKPTKAYLSMLHSELNINQTQCCFMPKHEIPQRCIECNNFQLCGGLLDSKKLRCVNFEFVMKSMYKISNFTLGTFS